MQVGPSRISKHSRAIKHLIIYTDNKYRLLNRILGNKGDKYAALEIVDDRVINNNNYSHSNDDIGNKVTKSTEDKSSHNFYDAKELGRLLNNSAESIVERLLGRPNEKLSSASKWRYGNKGSLAINMSGDNKGLWHNFETGESGNLFTLIQKEVGLSFRESLKYVSDMFGEGFYANISKYKAGILANQKNSSDKIHNKENNKEESKTARYAKQLASESIPIVGTIVEKYLKEIRGINNIDGADILYHPKVYTGKNEERKYSPAMISIGRNKDGEIQCVQATYLDPKTANKADLDVKKRTYASSIGASVLLRGSKPSNKSQITFIAEGIETGLSIRDAVKNDTIVTLGKSNFANIDPESVGQKVIFCLDNDGAQSFKDGVIHKAAERLIAHGKEVLISIPNQINHAKTDFNDVARAEEIGTVRKNIDGAISYVEFSKNFKADYKNIGNDFTKQPDVLLKNKELSIGSADKISKNIEQPNQQIKQGHQQINKKTLGFENDFNI